MRKGPSAFRQEDVKRAVAGVRKAGYEVARVEIEGSKIVVITTSAEPRAAADEEGNEWDSI
jgi:hypothetical protein